MDVLTFENSKSFRDWLNLNISSITWEGRYLKEFNEFWGKIFTPDGGVEHHIKSLNILINTSQDGPLISWFKWIKSKYLCYLFINSDINLIELSRIAAEDIAVVSTQFRDFFVDRFPEYEEVLNESFQLSNVMSGNHEIKFLDLEFIADLKKSIEGTMPGEVLSSLEVTLYPEWSKLSDLLGDNNNKKKTKTKIAPHERYLSGKFQFLSEVILLFFLGALLILGIKLGNTIYEEYLVKNILLFEPNFLKLDTSLAFKVDNLKAKDIAIKLDELENLEKIESREVFSEDSEAQRFEVETDVVLTSVDALPKDFDSANLEQSDYEELRKGGYRNSRFGRKKAYRVLMTSVDPNISKDQVLPLLEKYKVEQADNVVPGTEIPGGIYFNVYIDRQYLSKFLADLNVVGESTILESRTSRGGGPDGSDKVFIWIKSI